MAARRSVLALLALVAISLGEIRLRDRLLYQNDAEVEFVVLNVEGIRAGRPIWKSSQHRLFAPAAVAAVAAVTGLPTRGALQVVTELTLAGGNLLLFWLARRKRETLARSVAAVALFALWRLLLTYKLEYPWDGIDVMLFLAVGHWAWRGGRLLPLMPLLALGAINHETVLFIPLWYLLAPLDDARRSRVDRVDAVIAAAAGAVVAGVIATLRARLYLGPAAMPGDAPGAVVGNAMHLAHNLQQIRPSGWASALRGLTITSLVASVVVTGLALRGWERRAAAWSACVLASVFLFGYLTEVRLYLPLVAFWFSHAWPATDRRDPPAAA